MIRAVSLSLVTLAACGPTANETPNEAGSPSSTSLVTGRQDAALPEDASGKAAASVSAFPPSVSTARAGDPNGACPDDMRLVAGNYCPLAEHICESYSKEPNAAPAIPGVVERSQCQRYASPAKCSSPKREPMRFCMDTYEWPNRAGVIPRNLTSWQEAKDFCEAIGKRLCTDVEFTFACEGESMKPHVTGFERDPSLCSYDRKYRLRTYNFLKHEACQNDLGCRIALAVMDQRVPTGAMDKCVSDHGVHDLNGNVNEWVQLPNKGFSKRAGLKGGWWGPVRDRCRPITTFHGESDFGYEVGFRCCKDASPVRP